MWIECVKDAEFFDLHKVLAGLAATNWPGRHHQHIDSLGNHWFIDGAHTMESINYAVKWFSKNTLRTRDSVLLFHVSHDRPFETLLEPLIKFHQQIQPFQEVIFVRPQSPTDPIDIDYSLHIKMSDFWTRETGGLALYCSTADLVARLDFANRALPRQIFATGSLYLVGDILKIMEIPVL